MAARDIALEKKWRDRIKECSQSGLSIKGWCQQNGLKDTSYHYWVKRFKFLDQLRSKTRCTLDPGRYQLSPVGHSS